MICENCQERPATVTITQVVNGQKSENHYCEVCASKFHPFNFEMHKNEQIPIHQLVSNWFGLPIWQSGTEEKQQKSTTQQGTCPGCGATFRKILKDGKLGCPECYETFSDQLPTVLAKIQAGTKHIGRTPGKERNTNELLKKQLNSMREQLQLAIQEERFEDAAKLRDEIKELESKIEMGGVD